MSQQPLTEQIPRPEYTLALGIEYDGSRYAG